MKYGSRILTCVLAGAAFGVEPPAPVTPSRPAAEQPAPLSGEAPAPRKPLDLRIGDIRGYMMPKEYQAAVDQPDADKNTIVVEAKRELLTMKFEKPIPAGFPPLTLWWALRNPAQSWRTLLPDINAPEPGPPSVVPPPVFRPGP